jgi:uncharacterized phosphosugar-binding protein
MTDFVTDFSEQVQRRLAALTETAASGGLDGAIELVADSVAAGGVVHAFGTGHSEAFSMEIAGRAGGLIPTNRIALRDLVLRGSLSVDQLGGSELERDPSNVQELWNLSPVQPGDVFMIASNSGVNGSIVGFAELVKQHGHPLIAVTSLEHTMRVTPKHPSGRRLRDLADVVIDNLAPYGDATSSGEDTGGVPMGAVSSITCAFIAQLITMGVARRLAARGETPPVYLSANIPGGDEHNSRLEDRYRGRIHRGT